MWAMRFLVLAVVTLGACAPSDAVRSYAYVDNARADRGTHFADEDQVHNECDLHAEVPKRPVAHRPENAAPELLDGAIAISSKLDDAGEYCDEFANTWQLVTYEPNHPDRAELVLPKKYNSITTDLLIVGFELALLIAIKDRYAKIRAARLGLSS